MEKIDTDVKKTLDDVHKLTKEQQKQLLDALKTEDLEEKMSS
jgi:hypothetical protein